MSCYFRNKEVKGIFDEAGVKPSPENKKGIDQKFHRIVEVVYKNCGDIWPKVKGLGEDLPLRKKLISGLKQK